MIVKSADRAKFKGYLNKWTNAKYLLGCALFADLLPSSIFSKCMQADEMDILGALTNLLRKCVTERIRTRLSWSDLQLFRDIISMLSTHGWQKLIDEQSDTDHSEDGEDPLNAIDRLTERFKFPLEKAGAELSASLRQRYLMRPSLYLWLPWSTNQSGGDCFMHQTSPSGQMSSFSPTFFSLFQCRMASSSGHSLRLTSSNLAKDLLSVQIR